MTLGAMAQTGPPLKSILVYKPEILRSLHIKLQKKEAEVFKINGDDDDEGKKFKIVKMNE